MATPENPDDAALGGDAAGDDAEAARALLYVCGRKPGPRIQNEYSIFVFAPQ